MAIRKAAVGNVIRLAVVCSLLCVLQSYCNAAPLEGRILGHELAHEELLHHFNPVLNEDRISEVHSVLQQLHRHATEKRFRSSGDGGDKVKHALDLENNNITFPLNETEGNVTVDINIDEKSSPDLSSASGFLRKYLFEGDILLTPEQGQRLLTNLLQLSNANGNVIRRRQKRTALINGDDTKWESLPVRYNFDASIIADDKEPIKAAIEYWQTHTCISFQYAPGATDGDYISFFRGNGCYSMVGKVGGKQGISVGDGCAQLGVVAHEVGHALGMWHEQSRPDSDRYIRVVPKNIIDGTLSNFLQRSWSETNTYGVSYDLGSVMHYGPSAFAIDSNEFTIETLLPGYQHTVGQREHPSFLDVMAINKAYCDNRCSHRLACYHGGYTHPLACNECICPDGLAGTYCERPADPKNAECGGIIGVSDDWTSITSPNYPEHYETKQRCVWLFRADSGSRVLFQFVDNFKLYCSSICYDYVEIKNDTDFSKTGMRFCCTEAPVDLFYSSTNEMLVIFNSQTTTDVGFKARAIQYTPGQASIVSGRSTPAVSTDVSEGTTSTIESTVTSDTTTTTTASTTSASTIDTTTETDQATITTVPSSTELSSTSAEFTSTEALVTSAPTALGSSWSVWSAWSTCSKTCGACGVKSRHRDCLDGSCTGEAKQFKRCPLNICPGDTTCSKLMFLDYPCGDGGRVCSSVHEVTVKCNFPSCCSPFKPSRSQCELPRMHIPIMHAPPVGDGNWDEWSEWGECFGPKCGGCARQVRHRMCQDEKCKGEEREFRPCNTAACSCSDTPQPDIVEAPCRNATRKVEMCQRPSSEGESTCPCCLPLTAEDGQCV